MKKKRLWMLCLLGIWASAALAQTYTETGAVYPLTADGDKYAVNGFVSFGNQPDEAIYAKAFLWAVENICPKQLDGITEADAAGKSFACEVVLGSMADSDVKNIYYARCIFRAAGGKLIYYISDILVESSASLMKKVVALEKLTPEKKASHKRTFDDFIRTESFMLNKLFDFVASYPLSPITHWKEIAIRKPVKGMTQDECRLAFGKPQSILETNGEVQWMYTSSFYLFFKGGRVQTIIK